MLCSAYLDCKLEAWPSLLNELAQYCVQNQYKLVIGADTNTHSAMWNETRTHPRRTDKVEQGIIRNNLFVLNTGTVPTFRSHIGQSIIDVTMSNDVDCVTNWHVKKEEFNLCEGRYDNVVHMVSKGRSTRPLKTVRNSPVALA